MSYELITQYNSRNFTPAASVPATYGRHRTIDSITIHWWGLPEWNATFEGTTDFLCTNTKPTSAHEVIEAGRVAVIVNHGDASWAAGNAVGNATSVHLELNPRASDADYATAAERIRDIRAMHGKDLPLIPHRTWQATMCPGHYDLDRLDRMARGSAIHAQSAIITQEEPLKLDSEDIATIRAIIREEVSEYGTIQTIDGKFVSIRDGVGLLLRWLWPIGRDGKSTDMRQELADIRTAQLEKETK